MGLFSGPEEKWGIVLSPQGVDVSTAMSISFDCLVKGAAEGGVKTEVSQRRDDGGLIVRASGKSLGMIGGAIRDDGNILWFIKGPRKNVRSLMDLFLGKINERSELLVEELPYSY